VERPIAEEVLCTCTCNLWRTPCSTHPTIPPTQPPLPLWPADTTYTPHNCCCCTRQVHMSDAGQARAFFVKFRGEGVDDHGGPYRAALHTAVGEETSGLLDILVPCPNGAAGDFENRDKTMFNAALAADPASQGLYIFCGKLLALSCRHAVQVGAQLGPVKGIASPDDAQRNC
jgi:hypothetical protein